MAEVGAPAGLATVEEEDEEEGSEESVGEEGAPKRKRRVRQTEIVMPEEESSTSEGGESEDLLEKNTPSFRCLAQVLMSSSSLMKQRMRFFPPLVDPGLDDALNFVPPDPVIDNTGSQKYILICKEHGIVPISRILKSLGTQELNLMYYGLSLKQIEAISKALMMNQHVQNLILQDNWMSPEAALFLAEMLTENYTLTYLNLRECRIGPDGAEKLCEGLQTNQSLLILDLSFNSLGDEGMKKLQSGFVENTSILSLNLSHNYLGDGACEVLAKVLAENHTIEELDLSWNNIFSAPGMKIFYSGLKVNTTLRSLNLAWNTITVRPAVKWLVRFVKKSPALEHLDLSSNRLAAGPVRMIRGAAFNSKSLVSLKIGNNIITPDEAMSFLEIFTAKPKGPLQELDMENIYVNKDFVPVRIMNRQRKRGKIITIGGVLKNYEIHGPDVRKLLFERGRYLGMKPKKKKKKKDFGLFVLILPDQNVTKQQFQTIFKKNKMKMLDDDYRKELMAQFPYKKNKISLSDLKEDYLRRYPDTAFPPKKKKKGKKGGKKKGAKAAAEPKPEGEAAAAPPAEGAAPAEEGQTAEGAAGAEAPAEGAPPEAAEDAAQPEGEEAAPAEGEAAAATAEGESAPPADAEEGQVEGNQPEGEVPTEQDAPAEGAIAENAEEAAPPPE